MRTKKQIEKVLKELEKIHDLTTDRMDKLDIEIMMLILTFYKNHNKGANKAIKYLTDKTENDSILFE